MESGLAKDHTFWSLAQSLSALYLEVLGLPAKVMAPEMQITKDTKEFAFKVNVDKTGPPGVHKNLFCQLVIMQSGEPILHNVGGSELRIDVPLPPKVNAPAPPPPKVVAQAPAAQPPPMKRLTRLEQLRLEQEEREKAGKAGGAAPANPKK